MNGWSVAHVVLLGIVAVSSGALLVDSLVGRARQRSASPWTPPWPGPSRHVPAPSPFSQRPQAAHEGATTALIVGVAGLVFVVLCAFASLVLMLH